MTVQKQAFLTSEGDQFFARNRSVLDQAAPGHELGFYAKYLHPGARILEIGCSNGRNLDYLHRECGVIAYGIDPSPAAVESGQQRFPALHLSVGTADALPFADQEFDFVLFGFCLYLVDRTLLTKVVAESDRVLVDKGFLGITDFDVKVPTTRAYKHMEGLASYKLDYSQLFLAYPHYSLAEKLAFSHGSTTYVADPQERVSSVVLLKDHAQAYFRID